MLTRYAWKGQSSHVRLTLPNRNAYGIKARDLHASTHNKGSVHPGSKGQCCGIALIHTIVGEAHDRLGIDDAIATASSVTAEQVLLPADSKSESEERGMGLATIAKGACLG